MVLYQRCIVLSLLFIFEANGRDYYGEMVGRTFNLALATAEKNHVKYNLITTIKDDVGTAYTEDTIAHANFDRKRNSIFIIHGWTSNEHSPWYKPMKDAFFGRNKKHNVFYINWSKAGNLSYPISSANTVPVGRFIAEFIVKAKLNLDKVHIIGHSLGSHLASSIGKGIFEQTGQKLFRITATDPAGPIFDCVGSKYRLFEDDAKFVEVIHTDAGHYGHSSPLGHVDYVVNGGKNQPGCPPLEEDDNCSHAKSNAYFTNSIKGAKYKARQAANWDDYLKGKYTSDKVFIFGDIIPVDGYGGLYLKIT